MQESGYALEDAMKKHKAGHAAGRRGFLKGVAAGGASALPLVESWPLKTLGFGGIATGSRSDRHSHGRSRG